jgi:hypothetical protein
MKKILVKLGFLCFPGDNFLKKSNKKSLTICKAFNLKLFVYFDILRLVEHLLHSILFCHPEDQKLLHHFL